MCISKKKERHLFLFDEGDKGDGGGGVRQFSMNLIQELNLKCGEKPLMWNRIRLSCGLDSVLFYN